MQSLKQQWFGNVRGGGHPIWNCRSTGANS